MSDRILLDPTSERRPERRAPAPRLGALEGRVVGLVDISKPRGDVFLDRLQARLDAAGALVARYAKPTFTKPAPADLTAEISRRCHGVIEALAD